MNQSTREIAAIIQKQYHIPAMAHLTCITATRGEVTELLYDLKADGVENVLALRGDRNPDYPPKTEFLHADELVAFIRRRGDFGVSAACSPGSSPASWLGTATTRRPCGRRASPMPSTRSPTWWPPGWTASTFTP